MRDPVMYRILKRPHHRTGTTWKIYPMYDWAHGESDYIEQISHSLCSLEFENHRPLAEKETDFMEYINPESLQVSKAFAEPSLKNAKVGDHYQFQRIGYYTLDEDSSDEKLIFNRTVTLKDSYKPEN